MSETLTPLSDAQRKILSVLQKLGVASPSQIAQNLNLPARAACGYGKLLWGLSRAHPELVECLGKRGREVRYRAMTPHQTRTGRG